MSDADEAERQLKMDLMAVQIELYRAQLRWEPWKALAAMVAASAVFAGSVLAVSSLGKPPPAPAPIVIQLQQPPAAALKP